MNLQFREKIHKYNKVTDILSHNSEKKVEMKKLAITISHTVR